MMNTKKTLAEMKDQIAVKYCYCDWSELLKSNLIDRIDKYFDEAAELYAEQFRLKNISIVGERYSRTLRLAELIAGFADKGCNIYCGPIPSVKANNPDGFNHIMEIDNLKIVTELLSNAIKLSSARAEDFRRPVMSDRTVVPKKYARTKKNFKP